MSGTTMFETERLILRSWRPSDLDPFAAMNASDEVMRYFPDRPDREQSKAQIARLNANLERHGYGWWAVEVPGMFDFIGFTGVFRPQFHTHFTPCVEVGWRLRHEAWGKGYATEAGWACVDFAFEQLGLNEIISMAVVDNMPSRRVMERLGMTRRAEDDFGHPRLPFDHPLRPHVLYRLSRDAWMRGREAAR